MGIIARGALAALVVCALAAIAAALNVQPKPGNPQPASWPTLKADPVPPLAVFIGDSYSAGMGASVPAKRWTTLVAAAEGWREVNLSSSGTGYLTTAGQQSCGSPFCDNYQASVVKAIKNQAQVVVIAGGESDQSQDPAAEHAAIEAVYRGIHAGLPNARVIAVGPSSSGMQPSPKLTAIDAAVQEAAKSIGAVYVSLLSPPVIDKSTLVPKWPFIGDAGHAAIEARVAAALKG